MKKSNSKLARRVATWSLAVAAFMAAWGWVGISEQAKEHSREAAAAAEEAAAPPPQPTRTQVIVRRQVPAGSPQTGSAPAGNANTGRSSGGGTASRSGGGASQTARRPTTTRSRGS